MFHPKGPGFWELTRQMFSSTTRGYDLLAPKFEYTPFRTPDFVIEKALEAALGGESLGVALDLCCGTGAALACMAEHGADRLVGVDLSAGMLAEAKEYLADVANLSLEQADALDLPFVDAFDVVVSFGAFGHIQEHEEPAFVKQIFKALKPGGSFIFVTSTTPSMWSRSWLFSRVFNGVMRLRNLLPGPPFIMYYLTFLLPKVQRTLENAGFECRVISGVFDKPFHSLKVVNATKV